MFVRSSFATRRNSRLNSTLASTVRQGAEGEGLKDDGAVRPRGRDPLSIDQNLAAIVGNETVDNFQQSSFAASAQADDADKLIFTDGKTYFRKSLDLCGVVFHRLLKTFRDLLYLYHVSSTVLVPFVPKGSRIPAWQDQRRSAMAGTTGTAGTFGTTDHPLPVIVLSSARLVRARIPREVNF